MSGRWNKRETRLYRPREGLTFAVSPSKGRKNRTMLDTLFCSMRSILAIPLPVSTGSANKVVPTAIARVLAKTAALATLTVLVAGSTPVLPTSTAGSDDVEVSTHLTSWFGAGASLVATSTPAATVPSVAPIVATLPCAMVPVGAGGQEVSLTLDEPRDCWSTCHGHYTARVNDGEMTLDQARTYFPKCDKLCECKKGGGPCNTE